MHSGDIIALQVGPFATPVYVQKISTEKSPHTGSELRVLQGTVTTNDQELHNAFTAALAEGQKEGFLSAESAPFPAARWSVRQTQNSIRGQEFEYLLTLREMENLNLSALLVEDLELHPYRYEEEFHGEQLHIRTRVKVSGEDLEHLRTKITERNYIPIVRRGISDTPVEMRFGMCGWSEHEDGFKYDLILVDRRYDAREEAEGPHISRVETLNRHTSQAFHAELILKLADLLVRKGVILEEEMQQAREAARANIADRLQGFLQTEDVDDLAW